MAHLQEGQVRQGRHQGIIRHVQQPDQGQLPQVAAHADDADKAAVGQPPSGAAFQPQRLHIGIAECKGGLAAADLHSCAGCYSCPPRCNGELLWFRSTGPS